MFRMKNGLMSVDLCHTSMNWLPQFLVLSVAGMVLFLPGDAKADNPAIENEIINLATIDSGQLRAEIIVDPILTQAAQLKADDLIDRNYLAHVNPDGFGPNYLIQALDYFLPAGYDNTRPGNNIESIFEDRGFGLPNAQLAWDGWLNSPSHRTHVLGENAFFAGQTRVGVGVASDPETERNVYVFFTAPPKQPADVLPPNLSYVLPKAKSRPGRLMFHRGMADDPSGIERVQYRILKRAWQNGTFTPDQDSPYAGKWTGRTRVPEALYRKVRKKNRPIVIQVRVQDKAGNWSITSRRFKKSRR